MQVSERFRPSLALLTDLYQLTMAQGYWKAGLAEREACFHLFFRDPPFGGRYAVAAGISEAVDYLATLHFDYDDITYLRELTVPDGSAMFEAEFLEYLRKLRFGARVDAVREGTVAFGREPLVRVEGPMLQCQLAETPLLNLVGFSTLVATKAARVCEAAKDDAVLEFGLRRAQGPDGGITASRAAYVGGCSATSNVLAGRLYGIPVKGTHAHSWVMAFGDERAAFDAWGDAMPGNSVFLVDTYETVQGVRHAIETGLRMREQGYRMSGVRLDSGDLATLSNEARRMLDEAGLSDAKIVASGDLDEYRIDALKQQDCPIDIWGVGTRLATAYDEPALGVVYKLSAVADEHGRWDPRIKLSDSPAKSTLPGVLQVRRFRRDGRMVADVLYDVDHPPASPPEPAPLNPDEEVVFPELTHTEVEDLLVPALRGGQRTGTPPSATQARAYAREQLALLPAGVRRLQDPEPFPVALDAALDRLRSRLTGRAGPGTAGP